MADNTEDYDVTLRFPATGFRDLMEALDESERRRTRRRRLMTTAAVTAFLIAVALISFNVEPANAQTGVNGAVGDIAYTSTNVRNPSCSITRNYRNTSPVPLALVARAEWDAQAGEPVFPTVGDSAYTEITVLQPGEQITAVWNGVDRDPPTLTRGPVRLLLESRFTDGSGAFAAAVESVPACEGEQVTTTTTEQTTTTSTPATTIPEPTTTTAPETTTTVAQTTTQPSEPGVTIGTGVSETRTSLPRTGTSAQLALAGLALVVAGTVATVATRRRATY